MKRFGWLTVTVLGVGMAAYFFLSAAFTGLPRWPADDSEKIVRVAPVRRVSVPLVIRLEGELTYARETDLVSRLAGRVRELRVKVGDRVPPGAVVALIDAPALVGRTREIEAALDAARSEAKQSEEQAARAERGVEQRREWHAQGLIARRDLDVAEKEAETARAQVALAHANLAQQEAMLAQTRAVRNLTRLSAPFAGVISRKRVELGATVAAFDSVLTLADPRYLKFASDYGGAYAEELRFDMTLEVSSDATPEKKYRGRITRVEDAAGRRRIIVEVENQHEELRPGTVARGSIELAEQQDVLLVPRSAVIMLGGKPYVYKAVDGRAVPQEVALGEAFNQEIAISQGLKEGEVLIVDKLDSLSANGQVRLATAPLPAQRR